MASLKKKVNKYMFGSSFPSYIILGSAGDHKLYALVKTPLGWMDPKEPDGSF